MPVQSQKQFRYIQTMRSKYKTKDKAPENMKWIFNKKWTDVDYSKLPENKIYTSLFEQNQLSFEEEKQVIDKIIEFFMNNPYPKDHSGVHKFAESIGIETSIIETYIYAILSCFLIGGSFNKSGKKESDFSEEEKKMGIIVEAEHVDMKNKTPIIVYIANYIRNRIRLDHNTDRSDYYAFGKSFGIFEELK